MAAYSSPTIIQQTIPGADMTPLERLILSHVFSAETRGDGLYVYAEEGPADIIALSRADLEAAFAASREVTDSTATTYAAERLSQLPSDAAEVDLDLIGTSWEFIVQDIVRRSRALRFVTAVTSFTCSKM